MKPHKILQQAQTGDLTLLETLKTQNPTFHWSTLTYPSSGDTILHISARLGLTAALNYLLSYSPSGVNCRNRDGKTALHEAAQFSQFEACSILLENGAAVDALKRSDWTPLMLACTKSNFEIVELLVLKGAIVNFPNKDGWTALHLAARTGDLGIFEFLVRNGGDGRTVTKNGRSVLHIAALHNNLEIIDFILRAIKLDINLSDNCGNSLLDEALLAGNFELCKFLFKNGGKFDKKLLYLAAQQDKCDIISFLINEKEIDLDLINNLNLLHISARKGNKNVCNFLVNLGCQEDGVGKTASVHFKY